MRTRSWLGVGVTVVAVAAATALGATGGGTITTIAGTGTFGNGGEGGPATKAQLAGPDGVAPDAQGNLYIADYGNSRIAKVSPNGTLTTFAGSRTRQSGFSGDGGPASAALMRTPLSVAVDAQGNVYIGDGFNGRIRKVARDGTITTIAGNGTHGFSGDGGPATSAALNVPWGVAVDRQGNVYIADSRNHRVRKVSRDGTIATIAGTGRTAGPLGDGGPATSARLVEPTGLALDRQGNLYIADSRSGVRKVTPGGTITTVAGNSVLNCAGPSGPATATPLCHPAIGVAVDAKGAIYVGDNQRVHKVSGGRMTIFAGARYYAGAAKGYSGDGGPAHGAKLNDPRGLAVDRQGNVYIADSGNHRVRKVVPGKASAPPAAAPSSSTRTLRTFGGRIESYLRESARGRAKLRTALGGVLGCSMPLRTAAAQVAAVTANRRGLLVRLGALNAPTGEARRVASLLRQALTHSVAADVRYEAWIRYLQGQPSCSTASNADLAAAQREDKLATAAKQSFVAAYNPLARRLGLRTWTAADF